MEDGGGDVAREMDATISHSYPAAHSVTFDGRDRDWSLVSPPSPLCLDAPLTVFPDPALFTYRPLLDTPPVAALPSTHPTKATLTLLAHGTLPPASILSGLPTVVHRKLTLLTLASLAATADTLPYDVVARHLYLVGDDLDHAVEDAVVAAMDAGLLMARLDAAGRRVLVLSATPREVDPDPAHVARLADSLDGWRKFVVGVADQLDVMVQEQLEHAAVARLEANIKVGVNRGCRSSPIATTATAAGAGTGAVPTRPSPEQGHFAVNDPAMMGRQDDPRDPKRRRDIPLGE